MITSLTPFIFLCFSQEHRANLLWIPAKSDYNTNQVKYTHRWIYFIIQLSGLAGWIFQEEWESSDSFAEIRECADTSSTEEGKEWGQGCIIHLFFQMLEVYKKVEAITVNGKTFGNICARWEGISISKPYLRFLLLGFLLQTFFRQKEDESEN